MKQLFFFLFITFLHQFSFSQTQDLVNLAKGDYLGFNAVFDQSDNLFGYVSLYGYGKSGEKTKKFEYVILDKNLNPVANKEFEGDITAANYYAYMDFKGDIILRPSNIDYYAVKAKELFTPSSMQINIKENTIKRKVYYDFKEGRFNEILEPKNWNAERKENKQEKREKGFNYFSYVYEIKEGGFLALEFNDYGNYVNNNSLIKFDSTKNEVWRYKYNQSGDKKNDELLRILEKDEKNIYCILQVTQNKNKSFYLVVIDMNSGKEIFKKEIAKLNDKTLESITSLYSNFRSIDNDKTFKDTIITVGRYYTDKSENLGFARIIINKSTFEIEESVFLYTDFTHYLSDIDRVGNVEDGYMLIPKDIFFLKDGSVGVLMEKYKPLGAYSASKTTDLVYIYTDKEFKIKGVKIFKKEKTKWFDGDYLFFQYINNNNDVVFFYRDLQKDKETKEKNWNLYINTLINGEFKQEQIPISQKDDFFVSPYVAKEGYILLREFNQKAKYNRIRLERLNY